MRTTATPEQIATYQEQGFLVIEDLLTPAETDALETAVDGAIAAMGDHRLKPSDGPDWREEDGAFYTNALKQRLNLWRLSSTVREVMLGEGIAGLCGRLAQVDGLRCYHDQALYKPAWGNPTAWHLDNPYWPFSTRDAISIWIALQDADLANGCLHYIPGSHRDVSWDNVGIGEQFGDLFRVYPGLRERDAVATPLRRGSAVVHNGLTAHAAGANASPRTRKAMTCAYMPVGCTFNGTRGILPPSYLKRLAVGDVLDDDRELPLCWMAPAAVTAG